MKILSQEDQAAYQAATINGGMRGAALGTALAIPSHFGLMRYSPQYRALPLPLKAFGAVVIVVPCISITAEKAGEAFERAQWTGVGKRELDLKEEAERRRWDAMSTNDRIKDWSGRHKWGIIAGAWAASMGIAFGAVARTPQSFSQKLVQARMWAQGLTVGTLIGSAVLSGMSTPEDTVIPQRADHSWRNILEEEGVLVSEGETKTKPKQPQHAAAKLS